jgi:hypothetical protein
VGKGGCMWDWHPQTMAQAALLAREDPTSRTGMAARRRALLQWLRKMPASAGELSSAAAIQLGSDPSSLPAPRRAALQPGTSALGIKKLLARAAASITLRAPQTGLMPAGIVQATTRTTWLCAGVDRPPPAWDPLH